MRGVSRGGFTSYLQQKSVLGKRKKIGEKIREKHTGTVTLPKSKRAPGKTGMRNSKNLPEIHKKKNKQIFLVV